MIIQELNEIVMVMITRITQTMRYIKSGMKNLRRKNKGIILVFIFILLTIYFLCCTPIYVRMKSLGFPKYHFPEMWDSLDTFIFNNKYISSFSRYIEYKIPEWTMPVAVIVNGINMFFGFKDYKKKWWYYIILLISILISVMLIDCWHILYTMP